MFASVRHLGELLNSFVLAGLGLLCLQAKNLGLDDMELGEIDPDILDGPGPGMRELKLDYGFDLPEGMSLRGIKLDPQDRED